MDARTRAVTSIEQAREDLDRALAELDQIPAFNPHIVGSVAHTLNNYASVMSATTAMLRNALPHPEPEVATWLGAIDHATVYAPHDRATAARRGAARFSAQTRIRQRSAPDGALGALPPAHRRDERYRDSDPDHRRGPPAWADRVAVAVIVDNLLAYTIARSNRRATIRIEISAEPDHVICSFSGAV